MGWPFYLSNLVRQKCTAANPSSLYETEVSVRELLLICKESHWPLLSKRMKPAAFVISQPRGQLLTWQGFHESVPPPGLSLVSGAEAPPVVNVVELQGINKMQILKRKTLTYRKSYLHEVPSFIVTALFCLRD